MRAEFKLPSVDSDEVEKKRPMVVCFQIPYHTVSGIQVSIIMSIYFNYFEFVRKALLSCRFVFKYSFIILLLLK